MASIEEITNQIFQLVDQLKNVPVEGSNLAATSEEMINRVTDAVAAIPEEAPTATIVKESLGMVKQALKSQNALALKAATAHLANVAKQMTSEVKISERQAVKDIDFEDYKRRKEFEAAQAAPKLPLKTRAAVSSATRRLDEILAISPTQKKGLDSPEKVKRLLETLQLDPTRASAAAAYESQIAQMRDDLADKVILMGQKHAPTAVADPALAGAIREETMRIGKPLTPARLQEYETAATVGQASLNRLREEGNLRIEGIGTRTPTITGAGRNIPMISMRGAEAATPLLQELETARLAGQLNPSKAEPAVEKILQTMRRGARGRGLAAAGLGGLLALMYALRSKGEQMNPAMQIQLMQQLADQQRAQQLSQSLVGQRNAVADKNQAQADLLRLQAMTQMGGGMGRQLIA